MIVAIICHYLIKAMKENQTKRLLVCGPTNKSVTVIAGRLFRCIREDANINIVIIGDKDRLLAENIVELKQSLVYTFIPTMVEQWKALSNELSRRIISRTDFIFKSKKLETRLKRHLASFYDDNVRNLLKKVKEVAVDKNCEYPSRLDDDIRPILMAIDKLCVTFESWDERMVVLELLNSAHVIFCTLTSAGGASVKKMAPINDLIVDEASAATEPELYIPFRLRPERLLLVGDPRQLPAAVQSKTAKSFGLTKSLQERLMNDCKFNFIMLDVQYRMRPEISKWPVSVFYGGEVQNGENVRSSDYQCSSTLLMGQPYTFLQVEGVEQKDGVGSSFNTEECRVIVSLLHDLKLRSETSWCSIHRIRIVTFYQAQVTALQTQLRKNGLRGGGVVVSTVDSSQGCESDIVIVSFVRGSQGRIGFLQDCRRLNVALTRAKYQLICVGNVHAIAKLKDTDSLKTIKALAKDAIDRNCVSKYIPRSRPPSARAHIKNTFSDVKKRYDHGGGHRRKKITRLEHSDGEKGDSRKRQHSEDSMRKKSWTTNGKKQTRT
mmetsp:Transcript_39902/g.56228  ORF Transcript_39902/g.56228 Transcript_39902/m.56228 type:complete len:549 (+) Transcript_39902:538-2184(+)